LRVPVKNLSQTQNRQFSVILFLIAGFEIDEPHDWAIVEGLMKNRGYAE